MVERVFLFGRPGSGKSTSAHCIEMIARDEQLSVKRFTDYPILDEWFHADMECCRFQPSLYGGFDIIEPDVYDEALSLMSSTIRRELASPQPPDLIVIDFARADYRSAFEIMGESLIRDSHFLLYEAESETCMRRIEQRVRTANSLDDHFTSEFVLAAYERPDYIDSIFTLLVKDYLVDETRITRIDNSSSNSRQNLTHQMAAFIQALKLKQPV